MNLFYAKSTKGELIFDNKKAIQDYLFTVDGKALIVKIERETGRRSQSQNNFYWSYLTIIANETGHTENELHELFKRIFLPPQYKTILGREVKLPASTTNLNKVEFGEYMDKICAETNVPIPDPNLFP
ncbi:MAG: hypothetical protein WC648_01095 [Candidatus Paceibacterota bacterium]|jgi:hypothetical protein